MLSRSKIYSEVTDDVSDEILDADVTPEEVKAAIRHLMNRKARQGLVALLVRVGKLQKTP